MEMIDEQRLRARLTALDAAVHMITGGGRNLVNNDEIITDAAAHFEEWLLRPAPADAPSAAEMKRAGWCPQAGDPRNPESCGTAWRSTAVGEGTHLCIFGALEDHRCTCGCGSAP